MKSIYLETSACLKVIFHEDKKKEVTQKISQADRIVSSRLLWVEAQRAILRIALHVSNREADIPVLKREFLNLASRVDAIEIDRGICELAATLAPRSRLRSLDAIHLATYLQMKEIDPSMEMLSFDKQLLDLL